MAKITLTLGQYLLMSETHIKNLVAQGFEVVIGDNATTTTTVVEKPATQPKVEAKPSNQPKVDKTLTKGKKENKPAKADSKKPAVAYGKVKKGDYFKVINLNTNKVGHVGKAEKVDLKEKIVTTKGGKKFALENCVAINKATYNKLKKSLGVSETKTSTSTRLAAVDYKVVYALNLLKVGKITEEDFAKAKTDNEFASELYKKFKEEIKLDNATALKIFAENTSAKAEANA